MDYKETYVRVTNEEEKKQALDFYKSKGWKGSIDTNSTLAYITLDNDNYIYRWWSNMLDRHKLYSRDITEEVLHHKKKAVSVPTQEEYNQLMRAYERKGWVWYSENKPTKENKRVRHKEKTEVEFNNYFQYGDGQYNRNHWYEIISLSEAMALLWEPVEEKKPECTTIQNISKLKDSERYFWVPVYVSETKPFYNFIKKPMSKLTETLFTRFYNKSMQNKLAELIEATEEPLEQIEQLSKHLIATKQEVELIINNLDEAVENNDKSEIKKQKKILEDLNKQLKDPLFKQLFTIANKLFKK